MCDLSLLYRLKPLRKIFQLTRQMPLWLRVFLSMILAYVLLVFLSITVKAAPSEIISLDVDTTLDSNDLAFQACTPALGDCSLRGAISLANADTGNDYVINLPAGTYAFSLAGSGEDNNASGDLDLIGNITLSGAGQISTIIEANQQDRVLHILAGAGVTLENLTIMNGETPSGPYYSGIPGEHGGGIFNAGSLILHSIILSSNLTGDGAHGLDGICQGGWNPTAGNPGGVGGFGGGLYNNGTLTITVSTIENNRTGRGGDGGHGGWCENSFPPLPFLEGSGGEGADGGYGGGIYNAAGSNLVILKSTLNGNQTGIGGNSGGTSDTATTGGNGGFGGGLENAGNLTIRNSTVSGNFTGNGGFGNHHANSSAGIGGNGGDGGGIHNGGTVALTSCTVTGNSTGNAGVGAIMGINGVGGGLNQASGTLALMNSIIAGNDMPASSTHDDCYGALSSQGYNLVGSGTGCPTDGDGDQASSNPYFGPLGDNGGDTQTHALLAGSPAIDQIPDGTNGCAANTTTDQRGAVRAGGTNLGSTLCDMGAYEYDSGQTPNAIALQSFSTHSTGLQRGYFLVGLLLLILVLGGLTVLKLNVVSE